MNSIESILGMVATEAAENSELVPGKFIATEPIDYGLEFIQQADGNLVWVE